jgi:hypothetical protein
VAQWGEVVPRLRQYELQQITRGKLRVDMNGRRAAIA